jgi:formamidopyrimidine-DNA glycosylase
VAAPELVELQARIAGQTIQTISRRGKYLVFELSGGDTLLIHLKMTGHLSVAPADAPPDPYAHTIFRLAEGEELRFSDPRKFGRVYLLSDPGVVFGELGPEPLADSFTAASLAEQLRRRRRVLKPLLLDQSFLAGVGNIYADEALYEAGLHPTRPADSLTPAETERLYAAIRMVLQQGINNLGASVDRYRQPNGEKGHMQEVLRVYGQTGKPCSRCGAPIERTVLAGRSTHYCPQCQR